MLIDDELRERIIRTCDALTRWADASVEFMRAEDIRDSSDTEAAPPPSVQADHAATEQLLPSITLNSDIESLRTTLDAHRKALAILAKFGKFKDCFFSSKPDEVIAHLVKLKACSCMGTGWVARDEQCSICGAKGYIEQ